MKILITRQDGGRVFSSVLSIYFRLYCLSEPFVGEKLANNYFQGEITFPKLLYFKFCSISYFSATKQRLMSKNALFRYNFLSCAFEAV